MGYYTRFDGSVSGPEELIEQFRKDAEAKYDTEPDWDIRQIEWLNGDLWGGETVKWYSWQDDLKKISAEYPHLLFQLEGEGEESGDIWKAWARNGKVVVSQAKIVFDPPGDLDEVLPAPDVEEALAKIRAEKRDEIQRKINALKSELDAI